MGGLPSERHEALVEKPTSRIASDCAKLAAYAIAPSDHVSICGGAQSSNLVPILGSKCVTYLPTYLLTHRRVL